ncbi:hypothetical protein L195_g042492, partial [Trifolium pratense]
GLLRSAGLKELGLPLFRYRFLSVYVPVTVLGLICSKELLCMLLVQGVVGMWVWFRVGG